MIELARGDAGARNARPPTGCVFADEVLTVGAAVTPRGLDRGDGGVAARCARRPAASPSRAYSGFVGRAGAAVVPREPRRSLRRLSVQVLSPRTCSGLPEERDEMSGLTPLERGTLVHALFEHFYRDVAGRTAGGTITPATLPEALAAVRPRSRTTALARLPEADRALEETRLLGSIVARGVAERVFELEAERRRRRSSIGCSSSSCDGPFAFPRLGGLQQRDDRDPRQGRSHRRLRRRRAARRRLQARAGCPT